MRKITLSILLSILLLLISCGNSKYDNKSSFEEKMFVETFVNENNTNLSGESGGKNKSGIIDVKFELGKSIEYDNIIVENEEELKKIGKEHSTKYYAYINDYSYLSESERNSRTFEYYDVANNKRFMKVNESITKNNYKWDDDEGVMSKKSPVGYKMRYGIDISKHNGNVDFNKVKKAGFDFVFIRIAYRGYGSKGNLKVDEMQDKYLKEAKEAGLKVGAYVFSQSINEEEAKEEAKLAIDLLKDYKLDLSLVFDPETIKGDTARTDDISGEQFTKNAIVFCEEVKRAGITPAIYSNLVWEDYYYNLEKLKDYEIWYADYNKLPQTPYNFKYWQFSEVGIVDGIDGNVDLNVMIE